MSAQAELSFHHAPRSSYQRFSEFHAANPHIYAELVKLARQAKAAGRTQLGIRMLWERMRWTFSVETVRAEGEPKLNDHLTSYYSRLIMRQEPDLSDFFEVRSPLSSTMRTEP